MRSVRRSHPGALALVWVLGAWLAGCEFIVRFDRDRIDDAGVRLDGEVVAND